MKSRSILIAGLALLGGPLSGTPAKPNIIILSDVHGYTDLGIHGIDRNVQTPAMDQLAANGALMKFGYSILRFDFKWGDNQQKDGDIVEFAINGDSAPDRRFNYRYDQTVTEESIRSRVQSADPARTSTRP